MMLADCVIPRKKPIKQHEITQINHIRNQCYYKYVIAKTSRGCKGSSVRINSFVGNRTWFIFTCRQLLDYYATVPLVFGAVNLLHCYVGGWNPSPEFLICCNISKRFYLYWKAFDLLNNMKYILWMVALLCWRPLASPTMVAILESKG